MSPAKMKATGRVKSPIASNRPPTNSITPCVHSNVITAGAAFGGVGNPNNFALPCSRKSSATTIRATLSVSGQYLPTRSKFIGLPLSERKRCVMLRPRRWNGESFGQPLGHITNTDAHAEPLAVVMEFNTGLFQRREYCSADHPACLAVTLPEPFQRGRRDTCRLS